MRTLSRRSLDEYRGSLDGMTQRAVGGFGKKVRAAANGFMLAESENERSVFRDAIVEEVYGRIDAYAACAQVKADDMFEAMVGLVPAPHRQFPYDAAEARVRSAAKHLFDEGDVDAFVHALESFIEKEVGAAANIAMAENVEKANIE